MVAAGRQANRPGPDESVLTPGILARVRYPVGCVAWCCWVCLMSSVSAAGEVVNAAFEVAAGLWSDPLNPVLVSDEMPSFDFFNDICDVWCVRRSRCQQQFLRRVVRVKLSRSR